MNKLSINKNEITIHSACKVDSTILNEFYRQAFPERINYLKTNWRWLNRSDFYDQKIPLVLVYRNKVIAHLGMQPYNIQVSGEIFTTMWLIDIKILPDFQGQGLGTILFKESMKLRECYIGFGNVKSMTLLKKLGFIISSDTYMNINLIRPFNHPRLVQKFPKLFRNLLNIIVYPFFYFLYKRYSYSTDIFQIVPLNDKSFRIFYDLYIRNRETSGNTVSPIRDLDYVNWRVFKSPNKNEYYIYITKKFSALLLLSNNYGKYIDILWVSNTKDNLEIKNLIFTMSFYGLKNGFSYIRFLISKKELSDFIRKKTKSIVQHSQFAFFSKNEHIFNKFKSSNWDFELIDSDFERFN